jgi:hypothetical protein
MRFMVAKVDLGVWGVSAGESERKREEKVWGRVLSRAALLCADA